jgi:hypothetical protein
MRVVQNPQMQIGQIDISHIKIDAKSRDDIPRILRGLQHLYMDVPLREKLFALLESRLLPKIDKRNGRPGMALWTIFVCGVMRLDLNIDYDRLLELMNQHYTLRAMLGHGEFDKTPYSFQALKDNISLLTPAILDEINQLIVSAGHDLVKDDEALRGRCDSFVVETDVHYPTDINLLYDALRKLITLTARLCDRHGLSDWRQSQYNLRQIKRQLHMAQNTKRSQARSEEQQKKKVSRIIAAHQDYVGVAKRHLEKAQTTITRIKQQGVLHEFDLAAMQEVESFMRHAQRQIEQITRRVMQGETIPHEEKVFSLFEPHTEWISKGKAGVPVEFGVRVCVLEDQYRFILHHRVMEKQTDEQVCLPMVVEAKQRFSKLNACSFDKGFHSPENQMALKAQLEQVTLPRKGPLSNEVRQAQQSEAFIRARRAHSAVESAINALEVHGLDRCLDHGIDGFKRYVALAIVARNVHRIGDILWEREQQRQKRKRYYPNHALLDQRAA